MIPAGLTRYVVFMTTLNEHSCAQLATLVTDDIHFRDPFNNLHGRADFAHCLRDMQMQLAELRIEVTHVGVLHAPTASTEESPPRYALRWIFSGKIRALSNRAWCVTGFSEIRLAADGRVCEHFDYWDAAQGLYELLPVVGRFISWLRRRFAVQDVVQH